MKLIPIQSASDFSSAVIPAGKVLTFCALSGGIPVMMYIDHSGNTGEL